MPDPVELADQALLLDEDQWHTFLNRVHGIAQQRRVDSPDSNGPNELTREQVATWLASKHLVVDPGICEVWWLRSGPEGEVRLLEVNAFRTVGDDPLEAVEFDLDVEGVDFRVLVVDVTVDQWNEIQAGRLALPDGWACADAVIRLGR